MLTFISFWRAAAIVLNDLGSSAFYAGGLAEEAVGKAAPWFILGVVVFCLCGARGVCRELLACLRRGGVYRIVKEALGGTFAKLSVSALMFDYVLTGPISGVSAGSVHCWDDERSVRVLRAHRFHWAGGAPSADRISPRLSSRSASRLTSGGRTPRASKSPAKRHWTS